MRVALLITMLGAMLLVSWLVIRSVKTPAGGNQAPITAIDRAKTARDRAEQADRNAARALENAGRE